MDCLYLREAALNMKLVLCAVLFFGGATGSPPADGSSPTFLNQGMWSFHDRHEGGPRRALLSNFRDVSPPGMWPVGGDDDNEVDIGFPWRTLLSDFRDISSPRIRPVGDDEDERSSGFPGRAEFRDVYPPGMWPEGDDEDEDSNESRKRALLSDLRDPSPPGMWPGGDDDDEDSYEFRRRALLSDLRDPSPPGMWPVVGDDDDERSSEFRRRGLTSDLRDICRPEDDDDDKMDNGVSGGALVSKPGDISCGLGRDEDRVTNRRSLLSFADFMEFSLDPSPPGLWPPTDGAPPSFRFLLEGENSHSNDIPIPLPVVQDNGHVHPQSRLARAHLRGIPKPPSPVVRGISEPPSPVLAVLGGDDDGLKRNTDSASSIQNLRTAGSDDEDGDDLPRVFNQSSQATVDKAVADLATVPGGHSTREAQQILGPSSATRYHKALQSLIQLITFSPSRIDRNLGQSSHRLILPDILSISGFAPLDA